MVFKVNDLLGKIDGIPILLLYQSELIIFLIDIHIQIRHAHSIYIELLLCLSSLRGHFWHELLMFCIF